MPARRPKTFPAELNGIKFTIPIPAEGKNDAFALKFAAEGDVVGALRRLISPEDFARVQNAPGTVTGSDIFEVLDDFYGVVTGGLDVGEPPASSPSSKTTARPSKRTSATTTRKSRTKR